jgi:putative solute:sodium symporter small subunit
MTDWSHPQRRRRAVTTERLVAPARIRYAAAATTTLESDTGSDMTEINSSKRAAYWKANLRLMAVLLTIWFIISYGFGIILVEPLNTIRIGGYKLGFWFAQQGSMYGFVVLIFVYARKMAKLDREYGVEE